MLPLESIYIYLTNIYTYDIIISKVIYIKGNDYMLEPIRQAATYSVVSHHIEKYILDNDEHQRDIKALLKDIHDAIQAFEIWYKNTIAGGGDIYHYVNVYKVGQGPPYVPDLRDRLNIEVFTPVAVTLNVSASGLLPFNLVLTAGTWNSLNFPDNTSYVLDASYTSNSLTLWQRLTNESLK